MQFLFQSKRTKNGKNKLRPSKGKPLSTQIGFISTGSEITMGGKKKLTLKQTEKIQARKSEKKEAKPSGSSSRSEKKTAGIVLPNPRSEKMAKEIKKMKALTPFTIASRFNLRLSVAKDLLEELEQRGLIRFMSRSRNVKIYTPVD